MISPSQDVRYRRPMHAPRPASLLHRPARRRDARALLRLPADLHARLTASARNDGLSFNEYCVRQLTAPPLAADNTGPRTKVVTQGLSQFGGHLLGAIVMGSWARGDSAAASDIDVLLVLSHDTPLNRNLYRRWDETPQTIDGRAVDVHFVHLPDAGAPPTTVWCEAAVDGQVWYDRHGSVGARLAEVRRAIANGQVVRTFVHGQPYWKGAA